MDDDVQAIDPPHSIPPHIQHLNGNAISFVVPDESTSGIPGNLFSNLNTQNIRCLFTLVFYIIKVFY